MRPQERNEFFKENTPKCSSELDDMERIKCSTNRKINEKLNFYLENVRLKIDKILKSYELTRISIEKECDDVNAEIIDAVDRIIQDLEQKKMKMVKDVEARKNELLTDFLERYEKNPEVKHFLRDLQVNFNEILNEKNSNYDTDDNQARHLIERLESLNTKIDDNQKLIPTQNGGGIHFERGDELVKLPSIGDINYDSLFKIDIISKIKTFNNSFQHRLFDLNVFIDKSAIASHFGLISKNKLFLLFEKIFGKVKSTFIQIIYYDGSVLKEVEIKDVGAFVCYKLFDKAILIAFQKQRKTTVVQMYDLNLKLVRDQSFKFEVQGLFMNEERIFLLKDTKSSPLINEYDYEFVLREQYGQIKNEKKPYYIKNEIVTIDNQKIYVKLDDELRILCINSGEILSKINIVDLKISKIYLDQKREKFLLFNGYNKLSYFNHLGNLLVDNKLRFDENFNEFQFTRSGHFAFINTNKNYLLAI